MALFTTLLVLLILIAVAILLLYRFYRKASRTTALVRTGAGGQRVILDGGCLYLPFLHELAEVNLRTLRLTVTRTGEAALITHDRLRVDVGVEFYLRVIPTPEGVATAAMALGSRSFKLLELHEMLEGKLIDSLRTVAARKSLDQLHEDRAGFVAEVAGGLGESLARSGLELESVSLTALDQTPLDALNERNAFNAVGLRQLAEIIADSRKRRAAIEAEAEVAVRRSQLEATRQKLLLAQQEEEAQLAQQQHLETARADQEAGIAAHRAATQTQAAAARIQQEQAIRAAELAAAESVALRDSQKAIKLAQQSREESTARAAADLARAEAVRAAESVETEKQKAIAERTRLTALVKIQEEADRLRTLVQAEAEAATLRAEARKAELTAEAEGQGRLAEAENLLSQASVDMKVTLAKLDTLPRLAAELVRPAEKIDSIRIHQLSGLGGVNGGAGGSPVNQAVEGVLGMAFQLPAFRKLGEELGLELEQELGSVMRGGEGASE